MEAGVRLVVSPKKGGRGQGHIHSQLGAPRLGSGTLPVLHGQGTEE